VHAGLGASSFDLHRSPKNQGVEEFSVSLCFAFCKQGSWPELSSWVAVFHLAKKATGSFGNLRGFSRSLSAGLPSCIYLCWLTLRSVLGLCSMGAEAGQRVRSLDLTALCSELTTEGKAPSVHESLSSFSRSRKWP
jgi:hypothetical protein